MYNEEKTDNTPKVCAEMQKSIDVLKWAQGALKLLPNLPKGKLKEELEFDIRQITNASETLRGQTSIKCSEMIKTVQACEQTLCSIGKLKRPGPNDIALLRDLIAEFGMALESFHRSLEIPSYSRF
jgi:hypothetical protein